MKYTTRAEKLTYLQTLMDLETGRLDEGAFQWENELCEKGVKEKVLRGKILRCGRCPGMNIPRFTEAVPGWGNLNAEVMFVGQSLHQPGVVTGLPFIGGSGYLIDAALRCSGLLRKDVFLWNVVLCHPPNNRASKQEEKDNCFEYLQEAVDIVRPRLLILLGNDAKQAPLTIPQGTTWRCYTHPASFMYAEPESRANWVVKVSLEMDKVIE